jgi:heme oxygenase
MKKKFNNLSKTEKEKRSREQFEISIELGYFTREEVENHFKKKKLKKKVSQPKKVKKPIIYYGYNTGTR